MAARRANLSASDDCPKVADRFVSFLWQSLHPTDKSAPSVERHPIIKFVDTSLKGFAMIDPVCVEGGLRRRCGLDG